MRKSTYISWGAESICLFLLLNGLYSFFKSLLLTIIIGLYSFFKSLLLTIIIYKWQESYSFCWIPLSRYYFFSSHLMLGEDLFFSPYAFGGWPLFWREMVHLYAKLECIDSTAFQVIPYLHVFQHILYHYFSYDYYYCCFYFHKNAQLCMINKCPSSYHR